mmetsp:Transcript_85338/g.204433  ORF Transcript_85338/g.204433 Transcript_85338/m.204433 type:complete len:229 (+) Transcript_85338:2084-2770(+)
MASLRQLRQQAAEALELGALLQHVLLGVRQRLEHRLDVPALLLRHICRRLGRSGRRLLVLWVRQLGLGFLHLLQQLSPVLHLRQAQQQQGVVAEPLQEADGAKDLDAQLGLVACLPDHLAVLQHLLVHGHLLLAGMQPHKGLLLGRQLLHRSFHILRIVLHLHILHDIRTFASHTGTRLGAPKEVGANQRPQLLRQVLLQLHRPDLGTPHAAPVDGLAEGLHERGMVS